MGFNMFECFRRLAPWISANFCAKLSPIACSTTIQIIVNGSQSPPAVIDKVPVFHRSFYRTFVCHDEPRSMSPPLKGPILSGAGISPTGLPSRHGAFGIMTPLVRSRWCGHLDGQLQIERVR